MLWRRRMTCETLLLLGELRSIMVCNCGVEWQRKFRAKNSFSVFMSESGYASPLVWNEDKLYVCIHCGAMNVPDDCLEALREGAGDNLGC